MFCAQFRPIVGGAERQAEKLSRALVQRGLRVTVLTPRLVRDTPMFEEDLGVRIHRFPLFDLCRRLPTVRGLGPLNLLMLRAQTIRAVSRHLLDADIVHMHIASSMSAFALQAARRKGVPSLCKVAVAGTKNDLGELCKIGIGGAYLAKKMVQQLPCWVATTQLVYDSLLTWGVMPERVVSIPNGVELGCEEVLIQRPGSPRRFLYLGRLSMNIQRDTQTLVRAFDRLADYMPDVELALVGDGDLYQETAAQVSQTRNRSRIHMPGLQSPEPWLQWADSFVLPSRYEGLSNALLEAMAHGLPCIANDIPQNREVLANGEAGILVPVGDEDRLLDAMRRMTVDSVYAGVIRRRSMERVADCYSINSVAERYFDLYKKLIHKNTGHC